jgi:hypothetical protein
VKPARHDIAGRIAVSHVKTETCWLWTALRNQTGYGVIKIKGTHRLAHRVMYALHHQVMIPWHMVVRHSCDTPACINPDHLLLGTTADNVKDRDDRQRRRPPKGELNGRAKVNWEQVREMRRLYAEGVKVRALAEKFGLSRSPVYDIVHGNHWK